MSVGYIYVLSNPSHPGLLKIGFTSNSVKERAVELSSTGVPLPFDVEFYHLSDEVEAVEKLIHAELKELRPNASREFFQVKLEKAIEVIEKHVRRPLDRFLRNPLPRSLDLTPLTGCRRCGHQFPATSGYQFCPKCGF